MLKKLHFKLAIDGIIKNKRLYIPYIGASSLMVFVFFTMALLMTNETIATFPGGIMIPVILGFGMVVIGVFSLIFLSYTNKFIIKNRMQEYGLLSILGLSKSDLNKINIITTCLLYIINTIIGLISGLALGKLMVLVIGKVIGAEGVLPFMINKYAFVFTVLAFAAIYTFILIGSILNMRNLNPINYMSESSGGEKEPKSKIILAIFGTLTLIAGYIIAGSVSSPERAVVMFFIAVILVILGTFSLFTFLSVVVLKALQKNSAFYYTKKKFIYISSMIYRIKQNALSLASICIICTMVLVTLSYTVTLFVGKNEFRDFTSPSDVNISIYAGTSTDYENMFDKVKDVMPEAEKYGIKLDKLGSEVIVNEKTGNNEDVDLKYNSKIYYTTSVYNRIFKNDEVLKDDEVLIKSNTFTGSTIEIDGRDYSVKTVEKLDSDFLYNDSSKDLMVIVLNSLEHIDFKNYGNDSIYQRVFFDYLEKPADETEFINALERDILTNANVISREQAIESTDGIFNGIFVLGFLLGTVFIVSATMIIYYKQVSEGMEDAKRYNILSNVGMSKAEIKSTINEQTNTVFFLPLVVSIIHLVFATKMIKLLLRVFAFSNNVMFIKTVVYVVLAVVLVYTVIYKLTAMSYYRIVSN